MTEKIHVLNFLSDDPAKVRPIAESELERRARQVGTLAGKVVSLLREVQEKLEEPEGWNDLRSAARGHAEDLRQAAAQRAQEWRRQAESSYQQARERAGQTARDYPLHVALLAGLVGFVLGAGLRIGRTNRAR